MRDWNDLVPRHIANLQEAWERRHRVRVAINSGAKGTEIARHLGVSTATVWRLFNKAASEQQLGVLAPVEKFLGSIYRRTEPLTQTELMERLEDYKLGRESGPTTRFVYWHPQPSTLPRGCLTEEGRALYIAACRAMGDDP